MIPEDPRYPFDYYLNHSAFIVSPPREDRMTEKPEASYERYYRLNMNEAAENKISGVKSSFARLVLG
jgi:hypothetical protein